MMVNIEFDIIVDPLKHFLIDETEFRAMGAMDNLINARASGNSVDDELANKVFERLRKQPVTPSENAGQSKERANEISRDQKLPNELRRIYDNKCQICDSIPFNGMLGKICEGHHIEWLSRGGPDELSNMVLLCPNHHSAVHSEDPKWLPEELVFDFGGRQIPIRLNKHLPTKA